MPLLLLSLLLPLFTGFILVSLFWPTKSPDLLMKCCLAIGVGFGVSSCLFFIWFSVVGSEVKGLFLAEIVLLIGLITLFLYRIETPQLHSEIQFPQLNVHRILSIGFSLGLIFAIGTFIFLSLKHPHGEWDAWTIWNLRARFLARGGEHWTDASFVYWFKPDYPLLIPATIARSWMYIGNATVIVPVLVAMLFTFATVLLMFSSLSIFRGRSQGFLAGLVLLGTPFFVTHGASQYVDVPLGFFLLATMVLIVLHDRSGNSHPLIALAGMMAGLSSWTKNEGLLFVVAIIASLFAVTIPLKEWRSCLKSMLSFSIGLLPVLAIVIYFKMNFAPTNDLVAGQNLRDTILRLADASRYIEVAKAFVAESFYFGNWSHAVNTPALLAFYPLILGIDIAKENRSSVAVCLLALIFVAIGYFFIYVTTPHRLSWHLSDSLNRLLLQLWPSFVFIYFMIVRPPGKAILSTEDIQ